MVWVGIFVGEQEIRLLFNLLKSNLSSVMLRHITIITNFSLPLSLPGRWGFLLPEIHGFG
jgi:hypothetical protein